MSTELTAKQKTNIILKCTEVFDKTTSRFPRGSLKSIANQYFKTPNHINRLFHEYNQAKAANIDYDPTPKKKGRVGRKTKYTDEVGNAIMEANRENTGDLVTRELAVAVNDLLPDMEDIPWQTIYTYCKWLNQSFYRSYIKPKLTKLQQMKRLRYVLSFTVQKDGVNVFDSHDNIIFLDEKWWYLEKLKKYRRTFPGEDRFPDDVIHHKSHQTKFMGTAVIGHPRDNFDGRVVCQNHVVATPAQRSSVYRPSGTIEQVPYILNAENFLTSQTKDGGVIDCIEDIFHQEDVRVILDGAKPHTGHNNIAKINQEIKVRDLNIKYVVQPPQSPDLNLLDLSFFASLQSQSGKLMYGVKTIGDLMEAVKEAWEAYDEQKIAIQFGHLFAVYGEVLLHEGGNNYKIPHSHVRQKFDSRQPLNIVPISDDEIRRLRDLVVQYAVDHGNF
jgi:hypothetical protein